MRKFKVFTASVLAYFMLISLVPSSLLGGIVKAAENDYSIFVKNDYYLRANAQYKNKALIAYCEPSYDAKELYISLVEGGKEVVLKKVKDANYASITSDDNSNAVLKYYPNDGEPYYEEFNFETLQFRSISIDEYNSFINNQDEYSYGYNTTLVQDITENRDSIVENALQKINESNNEYNFTISDKKFESGINGLSYINESGDLLSIYAYQIGAYNKESNVNIDLMTLVIEKYDANEDDSVKTYNAVVTDKSAYIEEVKSDNGLPMEYYEMSYYGTNSVFLYRNLENGSSRIIEIENNEIITNQIVDFNGWASIKIGNNLYVQNYDNKKLKVYSREGNEYKISNEIDYLTASLHYLKKSNLPSILQKENGKIYFSQIVDDNIIKRIDITNEVSKLYNEERKPEI